MTDRIDAEFMARAITLAKKGLYTTDPNPRVGCVLVKNKQIIAEGWHYRAGQNHAEIEALAKTDETEGATAYVTLEPCSHQGKTGPCSEALIKAGIKRVVIAMQDPNPLVSGAGIQKLQAAGVEVDCGVLEQDAKALNPGFIKRMQQGLPFIQSKLAMSFDGRTAMASGESKWITSVAARQDVHRLRAQSSAILTGINTILADDPLLNARVDFDVQQPVRVVLDSQLRIPLAAKILTDKSSPVWIFTCSRNSRKIQTLKDIGVTLFIQSDKLPGTDLSAVFKTLAEQQINQVWVEAGATLNGALLDSGLVDEWLVYMAPCVLGDSGRGLFHLPGLENMAQRKSLLFKQVRQVGPDLKLTLTQA